MEKDKMARGRIGQWLDQTHVFELVAKEYVGGRLSGRLWALGCDFRQWRAYMLPKGS